MSSYKIIYESDSFIVPWKPSGVLSVVGRDPSDSRSVLIIELQKQLDKQLFPVHRLDFEVSGLILIAKNKSAHKIANSWFENKKIKKKYLALSEKKVDELNKNDTEKNKEIIWKSKILRGKKRTFEANHGQWAETHAKFVCDTQYRNQDCFLWELNPVTGKPHQLRFEMSKRGFPIIGDTLYGSNREYEPKSIALSSVQLDFSQIEERLDLPQIINAKEQCQFLPI